MLNREQREFKKQIQELIDQVYEKGVKDGKETVINEDSAIAFLISDGAWLYEHNKEMYEQGLDDAWEVAKKICVHAFHATLESIFGTRSIDTILQNNTASEAIAKIKAYEEQKKAEIKVGDEVVGNFGFSGVVIGIDLPSNKASVFSTKYQVPQMYPLNNLRRKTDGRHFPQIAEVLKQLQEDENGDKED